MGILLVAAVGLVAPAGRLTSSASADAAPPFTATATPLQGLHDGQPVTINVKSTPGNVVYQGRAAECRAGVTYQASAPGAFLYDEDAVPNGPNCPLAKISSSADPAVVDSSMSAGAASPDGESMSLRVGIGPVNWTDIDGVPRSLTCDPNNPCELLVELLTGPADGSTQALWVPFTETLTFVSSDPLASCGGAASGALSSGASDALVDAWSGWTLDQCKQPGQTGAATEASFVGEGQAVQQFASGLLDIAYTSAGYDKAVGLVPDGTVAGGPRPAVAVPIGIGAEVLGVGNGYGGMGKKVPFGTVTLTASDLASLVSAGSFMSLDEQSAIAARNPHLSPFFFAPSTDLQVGVPSTASSSTWYLSDYLTKTAPDAWKVPPIGAAGPDVNKPRGIFDDFGTTLPDFTLLTTYTGRPALDKVLFGIVNNSSLLGGVFVVSDLTTSLAESLAPAAIQTNPSLPFVAPTEASMDAAVADMTTDDQGMLQPSPQSTDPAAYPLTYVQYALVPAQPLTDATCAPRTASQAQLMAWLKYLIGPGQNHAVLPDGLEPLTPGLEAQATAALAKVGATPSTCVPGQGPGSTDGGGAGGPGGADGGGVSGQFAAGDVSTGPGGSSSAPGGSDKSKTIAAEVGVPAFGGDQAASVVETLLALIGIAGLVTLAARYSSRTAADPDDASEGGDFGDGGARR
jgi:hypothetical protein